MDFNINKNASLPVLKMELIILILEFTKKHNTYRYEIY